MSECLFNDYGTGLVTCPFDSQIGRVRVPHNTGSVGHSLGHSKAAADYRERPATEPFEEPEMLAVDPRSMDRIQSISSDLCTM